MVKWMSSDVFIDFNGQFWSYRDGYEEKSQVLYITYLTYLSSTINKNNVDLKYSQGPMVILSKHIQNYSNDFD